MIRSAKFARNTLNRSAAGSRRAFTATSMVRNNDNNGNGDRTRRDLDSSPVPSSRVSRLFHYGSLATGVGFGAITESLKRVVSDSSSPGSNSSVLLSPANVNRIVKKFSQMRGAVLKIGQLISFQDAKFLAPEVQTILERVQNGANYMPKRQLERVMAQNLPGGKNWRETTFARFDDYPIAAASIGQVHSAQLKSGEEVAVKVQYPGVADSIDSDLNNLMILLTASRFLPEGLFLDKTIDNARVELKWECDYKREAAALDKFRSLVDNDPVFEVPKVFHDASSTNVLTMERMQGVEITKNLAAMDQSTKNWIATNIMRLCLLEIARFKYMQTDPNWANFLYNKDTKKIELLDFGAARGYSDKFIADYLGVLRAAVMRDREACRTYSLKLGYLTGLESPAMLEAHIDSILVLGEPFATEGGYDFRDQTVTDRVRENISVMLNERLTPPPEETYGLHRKLSGAFLLCAKMEAQVPCHDLFKEIVGIEPAQD